MKPFYFGTSEKSLFGIYHPPLAQRKHSAIVLCQPVGHEYIFAYRAFRQLAVQLARAGFPVLRFDYYGCGDSTGEAEDGNISQWLNDIGTAMEHVKKSARVSKVSLIGARAGATLSVLAATHRSDVEALVLWDPIVDGKAYIEELKATHVEWLNGGLLRSGAFLENTGNLEVLGFPISCALREGMEQIHLLRMETRPASRILVVAGDDHSQGAQLTDLFRSAGARSEYRHVSSPRIWSRRRDGHNALVPAEVLQSIATWVTRTTA